MSQVTVNQPAVCNDSATVTNFVYQRIEVSSTPVNISTSNCMYGVTYTTTGEVTLNLPTITAANSGMKVGICDEGGNAATNNITIMASTVPETDDVIIGDVSITINGDYNSVNLYSVYDASGSKWFIC